MSSWNPNAIQKKRPPPPTTLIIKHNSGFFSCCSVRLDNIVKYFNQNRTLPLIVDSSAQFDWYKPPRSHKASIVETYFTTDLSGIPFRGPINYGHWFQLIDYKKIEFKAIQPFVTKYFSPSQEIQDIVTSLESKYSLDYSNLCVLFYRGNDKITETELSSYDEYLAKANEIQEQNPSIRVLLQSDETEFLDLFSEKFPTSFYFKDEIRHIKKANTSVDKVFPQDNYQFSKYFLAITLCMAKCKYVVCGSGNCSIWIALYRGNTEGMYQHLHDKWI